ncbi:hypothetical protein VTN00DRAFT_5582 [Thermoascus crustaceus]|uniref:uncharacterized protein n=1 Tax=Thermoascus crustaceus TaxID=5088 RepID=UPI003742996F
MLRPSSSDIQQGAYLWSKKTKTSGRHAWVCIGVFLLTSYGRLSRHLQTASRLDPVDPLMSTQVARSLGAGLSNPPSAHGAGGWSFGDALFPRPSALHLIPAPSER